MNKFTGNNSKKLLTFDSILKKSKIKSSKTSSGEIKGVTTRCCGLGAVSAQVYKVYKVHKVKRLGNRCDWKILRLVKLFD